MRWGVRDEMTNEHMTTALCMNELKGCQKYSMGPNFIYFGAQKYGYRPIPSEIDTDELSKLIHVLETMGNDTTLLKKWYRKDNNKVGMVQLGRTLIILISGSTRINSTPHNNTSHTFPKQANAPPASKRLWHMVGHSG